jgi:hypothetical protein
VSPRDTAAAHAPDEPQAAPPAVGGGAEPEGKVVAAATAAWQAEEEVHAPHFPAALCVHFFLGCATILSLSSTLYSSRMNSSVPYLFDCFNNTYCSKKIPANFCNEEVKVQSLFNFSMCILI